VNIVRNVARKFSNRLKFCWLKVICCICQSNELEREIKNKTGVPSRGPAKNLGRPWPTQAPLGTTTVNTLCCEHIIMLFNFKKFLLYNVIIIYDGTWDKF